jgi:hypothetical protein
MSLIQRENKVGIKKATTWGTAVQPSTGNGVYVKGHTPPKGSRKTVINSDEFGRGMATSGEVMEYDAQSGTMSMRLYWEGLESILASLMGIYTSTPAQGDTGVNVHKFKLDTSMDSIIHTIAWDEGDDIKAVDTAKIVSGTFGYADGLNMDIGYLGDKVSVTNWTGPLGVTYPSEGKGIFKLSQATVEINDQDGADFQESDKFHPSGLSTVLTRGFEAIPVTAGNQTIGEPLEKTAPNIEITLNFPKKESQSSAFLNAFHTRDFKKMRISFDAGQIEGKTSHYIISFNFPKVMVMEAPDFVQDTPIPTTVKFKALKATANPTGMDEAVPYITLTNAAAALTGYPSA